MTTSLRRCRRPALALVLAVTALGLAARPASAAARPRVAVLEIRIEGDAAPELRDQLDKSLGGGLSKGGWDVISRTQVARKLEGSPGLVGCTTTTCLEQIGEMLGAERFVRVRVSATGAAYTVELELLAADVATGPVARLEKSCAPCTFDEANDMMSAAAAQLREGASDTVLVRVSTDPPGAAVELDGKALGVAPLEVEVPPGEHVFRAVLAGRADALVTSSVARQPSGEAQLVALSLPALDGGAPPDGPFDQPPAGGGRYRTWKWVAAGGAAVALISGLWLIAIDGDGVDCPAGPGQCPYYRSTALGGTLLTVAGVGAGGVAAWMFLTDRPASSETPPKAKSGVAARPAPGGGVLFYQKTF